MAAELQLRPLGNGRDTASRPATRHGHLRRPHCPARSTRTSRGWRETGRSTRLRRRNSSNVPAGRGAMSSTTAVLFMLIAWNSRPSAWAAVRISTPSSGWPFSLTARWARPTVASKTGSNALAYVVGSPDASTRSAGPSVERRSISERFLSSLCRHSPTSTSLPPWCAQPAMAWTTGGGTSEAAGRMRSPRRHPSAPKGIPRATSGTLVLGQCDSLDEVPLGEEEDGQGAGHGRGLHGWGVAGAGAPLPYKPRQNAGAWAKSIDQTSRAVGCSPHFRRRSFEGGRGQRRA